VSLVQFQTAQHFWDEVRRGQHRELFPRSISWTLRLLRSKWPY